MLELTKVREAVCAIAASTKPEVEWAGVRVQTLGLRSPYITHQQVVFKACEVRPCLVARTNKAHLLIGTDNPKRDYGPPPSVKGLVGEWVGGALPTSLFEPIFRLAEELGLSHPWSGQLTGVTHGWSLEPKLGAYCYELNRGPVWMLANEANKYVRVPFRPAGPDTWLAETWLAVGELTLVPAEELPSLPPWARWNPGESYSWAVWLRPEDLGKELQPAPARRVLINVGGYSMYATRADIGPGEQARIDERNIGLPQGSWVVLAQLNDKKDTLKADITD